MDSLLALEPISEIDELIDLDERFFALEGDTDYDPQNCVLSAYCIPSSPDSEYCWHTS